MNSIKRLLIIVSIALFSNNVFAAFPQDFSDVLWLGPNVGVWPQTSNLDASVNGGTINVPHSKRNTWPISSRFAASQRVNASMWGFVKVGTRWYAGTWEFLRKGSTTRSTSAFGGAGHFRPPIGTFRPRNGEIYGFMVSCVARDDLRGNNCRERSNVVLWRWGVGEVPIGPIVPPEPEPTPANMAPILDLLIQD